MPDEVYRNKRQVSAVRSMKKLIMPALFKRLYHFLCPHVPYAKMKRVSTGKVCSVQIPVFTQRIQHC